MSGSAPSRDLEIDPVLRARLASVLEEGCRLRDRFEREVRRVRFHPFVASDYEGVLQALVGLRRPGLRFLEWGSATGVITIMADLLGFEAYGIEIDPQLVETARDLAARSGSNARFAVGSFLPDDYEWLPETGDGRLGTIERGASAYPELGWRLEEFDLVFAFPWDGETPILRDLMQRRGKRGASLLIYDAAEGVQIHRRG